MSFFLDRSTQTVVSHGADPRRVLRKGPGAQRDLQYMRSTRIQSSRSSWHDVPKPFSLFLLFVPEIFVLCGRQGMMRRMMNGMMTIPDGAGDKGDCTESDVSKFMVPKMFE